MSQFWKGSDHYSAVPFFSDADMNSENNRKELAWACGKYLLWIVGIFLRVLCFNAPAGAK